MMIACMDMHGPWKAPDKINNKAPAADSLYPISPLTLS